MIYILLNVSIKDFLCRVPDPHLCLGDKNNPVGLASWE